MSNYDNYPQQNHYPSSGGQAHQSGGGYSQSQGYQQDHRGEAGSYYGAGQQQGYSQHQDSLHQGNGQAQQNLGDSGYGQSPPQYQQYPSAAAHSSNSGRNSHNQGHQNQYNGEGNPEGDRGIMGGLAGGAAGAFGGHALGGKAGHGTSGTIIGALAGAYTGHKAQDAASDWKDKRDEKKDQEKQQQQHHANPPAQDQRQHTDFGANFSASSRDIRLDSHGEFNLHAQCRRADGSYQASTISLNSILENDGGSFRWSGGQSNGASTYTVQQGDTLRAIAARFAHCSFEDLARHNNISNPDMIYPGQNLQVPGGGSRGGGNFGASARNLRLVDGGQRLEGELLRDGQWHVRSIVLDERIANRNGCLEFV
ncbi:hypothetical protein HBI29_008420 [Parastagonospora nodorum]|nr:hypothetical protein HBH49_000950 [Parastagonospora nodorum]KAH5528863.1 hypothetical protein HBI29_008420 [Parastagonospora nodorum]